MRAPKERGKKLALWKAKMEASFGLVMLLVCFVNIKLSQSIDQVVIRYTSHYDQKWTDVGSGAKSDISIWTPKPFKAGFYPVGDTAVIGFLKPNSDAVLVQDNGNGLVTPPKDFSLVWSDQGSKAVKHVAIYQMHPLPGYVCLGHVATSNYTAKPDKRAYRCVKSNLAMDGALFEIWNDKGSGSSKDVSLWSVETDPLHSGGVLAMTFISTIGSNMPTEQPKILDSNNVILDGFNTGSDVAITLFQTNDVTSVWDSKGSGASKDVSIWKASYCCSLGHVAVGNYRKTFAVHAKEVKPGALEKPQGFTKIWNDAGSKANRDCSIWYALCPENYVALGDVAITSLSTEPSTEDFRCVHVDYVTPGVWAFVWDDKGSGANVDVSIWQANPVNASGQGIFAMSAVASKKQMTAPAYVLKSANVRILTMKPAKKFIIDDVQYNFDKRDIFQHELITLGEGTIIENCHGQPGSAPLTKTRTLTFEKEEVHSWTITTPLEYGIPAEATAGIPDVAGVSVSRAVTKMFTTGKAGKQVERTSESISATLKAMPGTSVGYTITGTVTIMEIRWTGKLKTIFIDDTTQMGAVSGAYYGTKIAQYKMSAETPISCH